MLFVVKKCVIRKKKVCWPTHYDVREMICSFVSFRSLSRIEVLVGSQTSELQRSAMQGQTTRNLLSEVFGEITKLRLEQSKKGENQRLFSLLSGLASVIER